MRSSGSARHRGWLLASLARGRTGTRRSVLAALVAAGLGLAGAAPAAADSVLPGGDRIDPATFAATVSVGQSVTITKTVTIAAGTPTTAKVDVFFLTDSTGSMFDEIQAVQSASIDILETASGLGDVAFGVGEYRDVGTFEPFVYRTNTQLTTDVNAVRSGINAWATRGGGDRPEANLFALEQVAETTLWRDDSTRILLWFGDAPGHDPRNGSSESSALQALLDEHVVVEAIDTADDAGLDLTGQATRIAAATGGHYFDLTGMSLRPETAVQIISDALGAAFQEYSEVRLDAVGNLPGVGVSIAPTFVAGDFDRSVERQFTFQVTFTGLVPGEYDFQIRALVDGGFVASEADRIQVVAMPEPATLGLVLGGLALMARARRRRA
jgi:hypothetical protein